MLQHREEETTKGTKSVVYASCAFCGFFFNLFDLPAVATATATAAATVSTATAAAIFTGGHRPSFGDSHVTPAVLRSIELLDGVRRFLIRRHLDEPEALAAAGITIGNDFGGLNTSRLSEDFLQRFIRSVERKISNV
jgi:hypothetical protein